MSRLFEDRRRVSITWLIPPNVSFIITLAKSENICVCIYTHTHTYIYGSSLMIQLVKKPPAVWETWVQSWAGKIPWRRKQLPTPVFWPGDFHGLYSPWGHKESDTTEWLSPHIHIYNQLPLFNYLEQYA